MPNLSKYLTSLAARLPHMKKAAMAGEIMEDVGVDINTAHAFAERLSDVELGELVAQLEDIEASRNKIKKTR